MRGHPLKATVAIREAQLELFQVEAALSEFEAKRKELKVRLLLLGVGEKTCCKCGLSMPIEQFHRDKQKSDKLSSWCRECINQDTLARYHRNKRRVA